MVAPYIWTPCRYLLPASHHFNYWLAPGVGDTAYAHRDPAWEGLLELYQAVTSQPSKPLACGNAEEMPSKCDWVCPNTRSVIEACDWVCHAWNSPPAAPPSAPLRNPPSTPPTPQPPPSPLPPLSPGAAAVPMYRTRVNFQGSGSVEDYTNAKLTSIAAKIAQLAGVSTYQVKVSATPASVNIEATIETPDETANSGAAQALRSALSSAADVTAELDVATVGAPTVSVLPVVVQVQNAPPPPALPQPRAEGSSSLSNAAIVGLSLGVGFLGAVIGAASVLALGRRPRHSLAKSPSTALHNLSVSVESDRNRMISKDVTRDI